MFNVCNGTCCIVKLHVQFWSFIYFGSQSFILFYYFFFFKKTQPAGRQCV